MNIIIDNHSHARDAHGRTVEAWDQDTGRALVVDNTIASLVYAVPPLGYGLTTVPMPPAGEC